ncbi:MAG: hypothetical protein KY476_01600 [Planctomycetes bacterium]|nr:hypothetical protein [Planctomycetota bacterium]
MYSINPFFRATLYVVCGACLAALGWSVLPQSRWSELHAPAAVPATAAPQAAAPAAPARGSEVRPTVFHEHEAIPAPPGLTVPIRDGNRAGPAASYIDDGLVPANPRSTWKTALLELLTTMSGVVMGLSLFAFGWLTLRRRRTAATAEDIPQWQPRGFAGRATEPRAHAIDSRMPAAPAPAAPETNFGLAAAETSSHPQRTSATHDPPSVQDETLERSILQIATAESRSKQRDTHVAAAGAHIHPGDDFSSADGAPAAPFHAAADSSLPPLNSQPSTLNQGSPSAATDFDGADAATAAEADAERRPLSTIAVVDLSEVIPFSVFQTARTEARRSQDDRREQAILTMLFEQNVELRGQLSSLGRTPALSLVNETTDGSAAPESRGDGPAPRTVTRAS